MAGSMIDLIRRLRQHDGHLGLLVDEAADAIETAIAATPAGLEKHVTIDPEGLTRATPAVGWEVAVWRVEWIDGMLSFSISEPWNDPSTIKSITPLYAAPPASPLRGSADSYVKAVMAKRYGAPSSWAGKNPEGWHLERDCTPTDASMHDNGCVDAIRAIRALSASPPEQPAEPNELWNWCATCGNTVDAEIIRDCGHFDCPNEKPAATDTAVEMYSDALKAANKRIAELEDRLWKILISDWEGFKQ